MPSKDQTMRWKVDISQFKKNIQDAKRAIQLANAEFKTATGGARDWASSMSGLEAKLKQLSMGIRQAFGWEGQEIALVWEQYLLAP